MAQKDEKKRSKIKVSKILLISGLVMTLVFAGVGIGVFFFSGPEDETFISRFTSEAEASESSIPLDEFLVNLNSESAKNQPVVRMEITVTSLNEDANEIIGTEIAKVRDAVIHTVSNQSAESMFDEAEGHFLIKNEIKAKINQALDAEIVEDVYITDILLQK
ncbi:flagellar basal body-associated FliL family protein [Alkalibacterium sp. f15]|uniref:flagellar basal body-associated FliL family protein n=1 Tax=Alkalibacterium sp. f15 TaxID=3414029 RepID=UPI003BF8941D